MPNSPIEDILSRATQDVRKLLQEAFEAGRAKEREDMKRNVLAVFSTRESSDTSAAVIHAGRPNLLMPALMPTIDERREHGTVKPAIKALVENAKEGILTSEIIKKTGFKEGSVRGTLSVLRAEGVIDRRDDHWFLLQKKGPQAGASGPS